jgi:hypothetical protein
VMTAIARVTNVSDYDPAGDPPGKVGFFTASALYAMASDFTQQGLPAMPVIGGFTGKISSMLRDTPALGTILNLIEGLGGKIDSCLRKRRGGTFTPCSFEQIFEAARLLAPEKLNSIVIQPIRDAALDINKYLEPIADRFATGDTGSKDFISALKAGTSRIFDPPTALSLPAGTVGIRDPARGTFRLIAPPIK